MPTAWASPYDVTIDKNGEVWTGSMLNDLVSRLNPETGKFVEYLLPRETNIRRVFVDIPRRRSRSGRQTITRARSPKSNR